MPDEFPGRQTSVEIPEPQCLVPRGGKGELAVRGNDNVRHKVVVAVQYLLGEAK